MRQCKGETWRANRRSQTLIRANEIQPDGSTKERTVNADDLDVTKWAFHKTIKPDDARRAEALWWSIGRVVGTYPSAEKWLDSFRYKLHPDHELSAWEHIARAFERSGAASLPIGTREMLLKAIIFISMQGVDVESQTGLSELEVERLKMIYDQTA